MNYALAAPFLLGAVIAFRMAWRERPSVVSGYLGFLAVWGLCAAFAVAFKMPSLHH